MTDAPADGLLSPNGALPKPEAAGPRPAARWQPAFQRVAGTALLEIRLNLFAWAPWILGIILSAFGYLAVRTAPDASSFPLGWVLSAGIGPLSVVLLLFLAASLAHRPQRYDVSELLDSKLVASEELIFGRWLGMVVAVLVPLVLQYAVTMIGQWVHSKSPVLFMAYAQSFGRLLPPVLFFTTFAFCLVTVTRVLVLGAGLSGLLWFAISFGQEHYPSVFRIDLTQNRWFWLGLTAAALAGMLAAYRSRRRAKRAPLTYGLATACALLLIATTIHAGWASLALPGRDRNRQTLERLRAGRRGPQDPLPNFAWMDARGRRVSLAGKRGQPVLLVFFQPKDGGLLPLLKRLDTLRTQLAPERLEVVAVCLSPDLEAGVQVASLAGVRFPVVREWGMPAGGAADPANPPAASAQILRINGTPRSLLIGEDGRELRSGLPLDEAQREDLKSRIRAALRGEEDVPQDPTALPGMLGGAMQ